MRTFTEEEVEILLNSRVCEKPKTNADRIRSFSDEELAEWFSTVTDDVLRGSTWSKDGWMKYLQSEVEVGE